MDILIADDSKTSRKLIKGILNRMNFDVIEAIDGLDAWNKLQAPNPPRIALIDWMMPNLSGIELVKKIRQKEKSFGHYTYIIMITSNSDEKDANAGFDSGVDNFLTKPIGPDSLSITLKIASRIIKQQESLYQTQEKLALQLSKQKEEIMRAKEIQQILNTYELPIIDNVNIRAVYNPSQDMGGDFFNIVKTVRGNLAVIMVDCTGHGLEASMYATLLKSVCDRHIYLLDNPKFLANFVQMVNIDVAGYITSDQFPVMFVSVYDPVIMKLYYSSANGEHPYLIRNGASYPLVRAQGMHLGYNTESQYVIKSLKVEVDDILLFYSDAIIEIEGASWNRHNDEELKSEISKMGENLTQDNHNFMKFVSLNSGSTILEDDLSLIYFQIKEPSLYTSQIYRVNGLDKNVETLSEILYKFDYNNDEIQRIIIAYRELILNSIEHGNKNDNSKKVTIDHSITCRSVEFTIEDEGEGFNEKLLPDPTDLKRLEKLLDNDDVAAYTHGRGIWLVRKLMNNLHFSEGGKKAVISKKKDKVYTYNNYKTPIENI